VPLSATPRHRLMDAAHSFSKHSLCWGLLMQESVVALFFQRMWLETVMLTLSATQCSKCCLPRAALGFCCFNVNAENEELKQCSPYQCLQSFSRYFGNFSIEQNPNIENWQTSFSFHTLCNHFLSVAHLFIH
jgi:hypothetical protein